MHEARIASIIKVKLKTEGIACEIFVPTETVVSNDGVKKQRSKFAGYIVVSSEEGMHGSLWHSVKPVAGLLGWVGGANPSELSEQDYLTMRGDAERSAENPTRISQTFEVGNVCRITSGGFLGYEGRVSSVDDDKVVVSVILLGKESAVTVSGLDLEKVA
jgi:transcription antitermination factor NusG